MTKADQTQFQYPFIPARAFDPANLPDKNGLKEILRKQKEAWLRAVLATHSVTEASKRFGIDRANIYRMARDCGLTVISREESAQVRLSLTPAGKKPKVNHTEGMTPEQAEDFRTYRRHKYTVEEATRLALMAKPKKDART